MDLKQEIKDTIQNLYSTPVFVVDPQQQVYKILDTFQRIKGQDDWDLGNVPVPKNYLAIKDGEPWYFCKKVNSYDGYYAIPASEQTSYSFLYLKKQEEINNAVRHIDWAVLMKTTRDILKMCTTTDEESTEQELEP